jgi:hydrogenase-4 component B
VSVEALWAALILYLAGALLAVVGSNPRWTVRLAAACAGLAGLADLFAGMEVLAGGVFPVARLNTGLPFGALSLQLDALSALFLVIVGLVSLPVAVYSVGYLSHSGSHRDLRPIGALLNLLLMSLVLILAAADAVMFMIAWEAMAFLSYLAVNFEYQDARVTRAGFLMLAVSELGTVGILAAFLFLFGQDGGFDFAALRAGAAGLSAPLRDLVFLLAFFGFGAKAGILPLQVWLPEAHPAAPSHISSLLSAVIIKLGIYGMVRVIVDLLGGGPVWWGIVVLGAGTVTALIGILQALVQNDLKRVLAYSSIENVGIILIGLGMALTFAAYHLTVLAALAAIAALYHVLNHAVYKGLLFLGAGAVDHAVGTRDLNRLGGLIRLMPWTSAFFLVAALAISAVPPLNGYISEWMILETMLQSYALPDTGAKVVVAVGGAILALTAAIAVTAFVRVFGVCFLGMPRSDHAAAAREVPGSMRVAMGFLALVAAGLGVFPTLVLPFLDRVTVSLFGLSVADRIVPPLFTDHPGEYAPLVGLGGGLFRGLVPANGLVVIPAPGFSTIDSPTYLTLALLIFVGLTLVGLRLIRPLGSRRTGPVWACGIPRFTPSMQYTGLAYSNPVRLIFNGLYRSTAVLRQVTPASRHREGRIEYTQEVPGPFDRELYRPLTSAVGLLAERVKVIQSGNVNQYVGYIFAIVLIVLVLRAV